MLNKPINIVFLGSPSVAAEVLDKLKELESPLFKISAVVTQNAKKSGRKKQITRTPVALKAEELSIPCLETENTSSEESIEWLKEFDPEIMITAAFGQFLRKSFLTLPKYATINLHPSLLPKYRGASPVQSALLNGDTVSGISILYTVPKMDAGNILWQQPSNIGKNESAPELMKRLFIEGTEAIPKCLEMVINKEQGTVQRKDDITHCKKILKTDALIDFKTHTCAETINKSRAFQPWPGLYCYLSATHNNKSLHKRLAINKIGTHKIYAHQEAPGTLKHNVDIDKLELYLKDGSIVLEEIQLEGKKSMDARELWMSYLKQLSDLTLCTESPNNK